MFPREISTQQSSSYVQSGTIVYNKKEMFSVYEQSDFIDCKVLIPHLPQRSLFIIIQSTYKNSYFHQYNEQAIRIRIIIVINYLELQKWKGSRKRLEAFRCFITQQQLRSSLFLDFSTQRLLYKDSYDENTNRHYTSNIISYKFPCMLPIPGTLNSIYISSDDEKSEIQIAQTWDSNRPNIDILLSAFQAHLTYRKNIKYYYLR